MTCPRPSGKSNGLTWDPQGRLVACEHLGRRISRTLEDGSVVTVVDRYRGKRLNSPNDLVFAPDGSLVFSDPGTYNPKSPDPSYIHRLLPDGTLVLLVGIQSHGQGLETTLSQIAHEELGIDPAKISVRHGDTGVYRGAAGDP